MEGGLKVSQGGDVAPAALPEWTTIPVSRVLSNSTTVAVLVDGCTNSIFGGDFRKSLEPLL
ncbi:hypothetical protein FOPG_18567 [Fusarium oxysporum f. sp. conglutinans race 2 54008]|uniref:Uncharacterized protein n=1 Tax=Fusarium oxysporum f. sp. conglutinans race 2 54008 TaxID=1089457 RepID=X0GPF8_FUSOX|nr:hypothetical protein FOPG_18567 [Fusarium oxysporum f. sp. conglutinans race 2 54008]